MVFRLFVTKTARIVAPINEKVRKYKPAKFWALSDVGKKEMTEFQEKLI